MLLNSTPGFLKELPYSRKTLLQFLPFMICTAFFCLSASAQNCDVDAGVISTNDPTEICAGDGNGDPIQVEIAGASMSDSSSWIITDSQGNILGLPPGPPFDLEGAGQGTCLIWYLVFDGALTGVEVGQNANDIGGCFDLSNPITVKRTGVEPAILSTSDKTDICAGDGNPDPINVEVTGGKQNGLWVITDPNGVVLGLPSGPPFDLEGAGQGTCLIWLITSPEKISLKVGQLVADIEDCYALSNPITVNRSGVDGGKISTTSSRLICAGDGEDDLVDVSLSGNTGENSSWVITDENGNILGLPQAPPFNFEGAGGGVCLIWHVSHSGDLVGAEIGNNASDLEGCFDLSNSIRIIRRGVNGGEISTDDPTSVCVGDGSSNFVTPTVTGEAGRYGVWIITDEDGNMLAFPKKFPIDFEGAGAGVCQIWHVSYMFGLKGIGIGNNIFDLSGCLALSNPITVTRSASSGPLSGGEISTNDATEVCVGDGLADLVNVTLEGAEGPNSAWVITDEEANILALPAALPFDFEGAGAGVCLIWHLSFEDGLTGAEVGANAKNLEGCFSLSNPVTITRSSATGGSIVLTSGDTEVTICASDNKPDPLNVTLMGNSGDNSGWVITDPNGNILGLPPGPPFDLDGAGAGTCLIWHISYADGLEGVAVGANTADLQGCFSLSNPITVSRYVAEGELDGGKITTSSETTICSGDGSPDFVFVTVEESAGTNSAWVITDEDANILALPEGPPFNFEEAGAGVCLIWHLSYENGLVGAEVGLNAGDLQGCYSLSNSIAVTRNEINGGEILFANGSSEYTICAGDMIADPLDVTLSGDVGENSSWIITDEDFNILGLPPGPPFDLEGAGAGVCLIWHASSNGTLEGVEVGMNALDINGCLSLSNAITVTRIAQPAELSGGTISTTDPTEICAGDGVGDPINMTIEGAIGTNAGWVITDPDGNILGLPAGSPFDLEGAGTGVCLIWHIRYEDGLQGAEVGKNANDLQGCFALSNPITVTRTGVNGGLLSLMSGAQDTTICVGDSIADPFNVVLENTEGTNSAWVITDVAGEILGLPPGPPFDLEGAGVGVCLVWHISFEDGLEGAEVGQNAMNLAGCFALSNAIMVNRVSQGPECGTIELRESKVIDTYEVFPNPATTELNIQMKTGSFEDIDVSIMSVSGQLLESRDFFDVHPGDLIKMDVSGIQQGYYLIKMETSHGAVVKPFIKNE